MGPKLDLTLSKKTFNNWLKGALVVLFAKEGLTEFVRNEISDFQRDLLYTIFTKNSIPSGATCSSCTTANLFKCPTQEFCGKNRSCKLHDPTVPGKVPNKKCINNICHHVKDEIFQQHRFKGPSWQITDATRWCSEAVEIAKCYLPLHGYENKSSFAEIDFPGTLGIIINNTRFQKRMLTNPNMCLQVREMINRDIRHSENYELSDIQLAKCIDALLDLLKGHNSLPHDRNAQDAADKINQDCGYNKPSLILKNNTLAIAVGDITQVLEDNVSERISYQQREVIQAIKDHFATVQKESLENLDRIIDEKLSFAINAIQKEAAKQIEAIKKSVAETDDGLFKNIKGDLITYYRENESQIPAAPLVEEHKVALEDLYVIPPLWAYDDPYRFGPYFIALLGQKSSDKDATKRQRVTVSQIFLSGDNQRYKKIYITANAGCGKTSFSQKLTMTWCQANRPLESLTENYEDAELDAMKYFDLLFLLHLRDYQSEPMCKLDDLIMQMVAVNLPSNTLYTKEVLQRLLHERKCLIIVDSLDEWAHPDKCGRMPAVPHNNYPDSCTVLTTSRPWKLGTIGLSEHNIDRHIEIAELDVKTREQLEISAVRILNEKGLNLAGKDRVDFDKDVKSVKIGEIIYIPYILLQLMCLFFGGLPIGKSKCEIYSNITEFTLKRGLIKKNVSGLNVQSNDNPPVPICMKDNETCKLYTSLIMKLGKLACFTLFDEKKETSLIFDSRVVTQYLTEQEIDFCLKVGLLCQTKDNSILAERRYKVFFHHKSVQEFFSAIYITSEWENNTVQSTIFNACSSLTSSLEMSNLFVFVCGMNHEVYTCISGELKKIVERDKVTCRYRPDLYTPFENSVYFDDRRTLKSYQSMQVQCFQECVRNRNESCSIHLYDIVLDDSLTEDDLTDLNKIILLCNDSVKSLQLEFPDEKIDSFVKSMDPDVFTSLETFRVDRRDKEPVWLADIHTEHARTLKCLTLSGTQNKYMSLSDSIITVLTGLTCLQSLFLWDVNMTHSNLKRLYVYISQITTLTQLKLLLIDCSDHKDEDNRDCDVTLDLRLINELKVLYLYWVPCRKLHIRPIYLEKFECLPDKEMTDRACDSLLEDLRTAPVLTTLGLGMMSSSQMIQINHTFTQLQHQLQYLKLVKIDMGDVTPRLTPAMTKLERVDLWWVELSSAAWTELFHSVGQLPQSMTVNLLHITMTSQEWIELLFSVGDMPQVITVELYECEGPSRTQWADIVDVIKSTPSLSILQDLSINKGDAASLKLKRQ